MNFDQVQAATQAPANVTGVATPELDKALSSGLNLGTYAGGVQAANVPVVAAQNASRTATAQSLKDQLAKYQDALSGKNFQQVRQQDGGYAYYDPLGNKINIQQYAQATNADPIQLIKNSNNRLDIQAVNDFNNLDSIFQASQKGKDALTKAVVNIYPDDTKKQQALLKYLQSDSGHIDNLYQQFQSAYPNLYTQTPATGQVRPQGASPYNF